MEERVILKQTRNPYYPIFSERSIPFDSTQSRFMHNKNNNPGPGKYFAITNKHTRKQNQGFNTAEEKYNEKVNSYLHITSTNESVGPGSYSFDYTERKKSFNVHAYLPNCN
jgi:hypothetical protein